MNATAQQLLTRLQSGDDDVAESVRRLAKNILAQPSSAGAPIDKVDAVVLHAAAHKVLSNTKNEL